MKYTKEMDKQLFMNIYDMTPNEPLWEVIEDKIPPAETWDQQDLIDSIREEGFRHQINVDPDGCIRNGNARYWVARYLLEEENDERFRYLPVQRNYATGFYLDEFKLAMAPALYETIPGESKKAHQKRIDKVTDDSLDVIHNSKCDGICGL